MHPIGTEIYARKWDRHKNTDRQTNREINFDGKGEIDAVHTTFPEQGTPFFYDFYFSF